MVWRNIEVAQSCPTLCDPMDYSLPGSLVHGIFQARILEWAEYWEILMSPKKCLQPRVCVCMLVTQLCPTLCDPMDCSPPSSSVHGILQARILGWVAIPFSKGSSRPRDQTLEKPSKSLSGYNQLKRIFLLSFSVIYLSSPFGNLNVQEGQFIGLKNNSWLQIHLWNMDSVCVCVLLIVKILI